MDPVYFKAIKSAFASFIISHNDLNFIYSSIFRKVIEEQILCHQNLPKAHQNLLDHLETQIFNLRLVEEILFHHDQLNNIFKIKEVKS